jgi:hypothetical protein
MPEIMIHPFPASHVMHVLTPQAAEESQGP